MIILLFNITKYDIGEIETLNLRYHFFLKNMFQQFRFEGGYIRSNPRSLHENKGFVAPWVEDHHPLDDTVNRTTVYDDPLKVHPVVSRGTWRDWWSYGGTTSLREVTWQVATDIRPGIGALMGIYKGLNATNRPGIKAMGPGET